MVRIQSETTPTDYISQVNLEINEEKYEFIEVDYITPECKRHNTQETIVTIIYGNKIMVENISAWHCCKTKILYIPKDHYMKCSDNNVFIILNEIKYKAKITKAYYAKNSIHEINGHSESSNIS